MSIQVMVYLIVVALMVADFATGTANGIIKNEFSSTKMREGLGHKLGSVIVATLGFAIVLIAPFFAEYPEIAQLTGFDFATTTVGFGIMGAIGLMEFGSVLENACKLNPDINLSKKLAGFPSDDDKIGGTD